MLFVIVIIAILFANGGEVYASAYPKNKGETFLMLDFLDERGGNSTDNWKTGDIKLYFEHGITNRITLGGYLKEHSFLHKLYWVRDEIEHDFYGNIFLMNNLYNRKFHLSTALGFYFPIYYNKGCVGNACGKNSEILNNIDTKRAVDVSLLFFKGIGYSYIDGGITYKIINDGYRDELKYFASLIYGKKDDSNIGIGYEKKSYMGENSTANIKFGYENEYSYKVLANYKFMDECILNVSAYKKYASKNSRGITLGFSTIYF